jgi:hypothetical protein
MSSLFKQNGSLITALAGGTRLTIIKNAAGNHALNLETELQGIGTESGTGMPKDNTIYIDTDKAKQDLKLDGPDIYFTAVDETEIYLNIKLRVDGTKTNHASLVFIEG